MASVNKIHLFVAAISLSFFGIIILSSNVAGTLSYGLQLFPEFAEPVPNMTVALGRDAAIPCTVNNLGSYKVAWIHMDRQMILTIHKHVISRIPRFGVSYDGQKTWFLNIANVQPVDRGFYMCQVNTNPMMSQIGYLEIVIPPNILDDVSSSSSISVRENQNLSVTCKASGFPYPRIMWRREDGGEIILDRKKKVSTTFYKGETMHITRINRADMGAYLCIASNGIPPSVSKRITIDVDFRPTIVVSNQLVGAPLDTDVTIDCEVEAHPRAISYWMFGNDMLLSPSKHPTDVSENSYRSRVKLTVKKLQESDYGTYKCVSKNSLGETERSVRIYEIALPKTSEPSEAGNGVDTADINRGNKGRGGDETNFNREQIGGSSIGVEKNLVPVAATPNLNIRPTATVVPSVSGSNAIGEQILMQQSLITVFWIGYVVIMI